MSTRHVLFVLPSLAGGGAERVMGTLLRHLDRNRFRLELAVASATGPLLGELPPDVPLHDLGGARTKDALPALVRLIRRTRPQVVFSTLGHLNLLIMLAKPLLPRGTRLIARETNIPSVNLDQSPAPRLFKWLYRRLYPRFDAVVCQSRDMRDDLRDHFGVPEGKLVVIHNPVDVAAVRARAEAGSSPYAPGTVNYLAAGKLKYQKGFDLLLQTFAGLEDPAARLTILGTGPEEGALRARAMELGLTDRVHLAGFQTNPYRYMRHADAFVLSSRFEGFPNVVLEALACGTPVAAFNCPGGIDEIITDGVNGRLAEPEDVAGLTTAMAAVTGQGLVPDPDDMVRRFGVAFITRRYEGLLAQSAPDR